MKKLSLAFAVVSVFFLSCNNKSAETSSNALLAKDVSVVDWIEFQNTDTPEWLAGFKWEEFRTFVFKEIMEGRRQAFMRDDTLSVQDMKERLGMRIDTFFLDAENKNYETKVKEIDYSEIDALYFKEKWLFDSKTFNFEKKIESWSPVRTYFRDDDTLKTEARFILPCMFEQDLNAKAEKIIASDITHIFELKSDKQLDRTGFDKTIFFEFILENIKSGKLKTYDPIYLVDKSKREFSVQQLKTFAGTELDIETFSQEVKKFIFVEDWYFNEKTFEMSKKVKAMAFVADRSGEEGWESKIMFCLMFE